MTQEQLWLAEELRKSVFSYKISILKAMLPGFLNSSYDKILYPLEGLSQTDRERLFGSEDSLAFSSLDLAKQAEMMRLTRKRAAPLRIPGSRSKEGQDPVLV